jgi:hypothetical protein
MQAFPGCAPTLYTSKTVGTLSLPAAGEGEHELAEALREGLVEP